MKLSGMERSVNDQLLISIYDMLNWLCWSKTVDARKGRNRPVPLLKRLEEAENEASGFTTAEDFEREWKKINGRR